MQLTGKIIRLQINADKPDQSVDFLTGSTAVVPRGFDLQIQLGVYFQKTPVDLSNLASLTLQVFAKERTGDALMRQVVAAGAITPTIVDADWQAGTAQHAVFHFAGADTALDAEPGGTQYWLFVYGLTTDTPGKAVPIGGGTITVIEEGPQNATLTPPEVLADAYLKDESDARYAPLTLANLFSIPAGKRLVIDPVTNAITVETITS